jgi:hypothetical protein
MSDKEKPMGATEIMAVLRGEIDRRVLWIYNLQDYHQTTVEQDYLWTPISAADGLVARSYNGVNPGEVLLHYAKRNGIYTVAGASMVRGKPERLGLPYDVKHDNPKYRAGHPGARLLIDYYNLMPPFPIEVIPMYARKAEYERGNSFYKEDGKPKIRGWISPLSREFVQVLTNRLQESFNNLVKPIH